MTSRRLLIVAGALLAAGLLAFYFADLVRDEVILPLAYFLWRAGQLYRAIPQPLVWAAVVVIIIYFTGLGLVDLRLSAGGEKQKGAVPKGEVETLARSLALRADGTFYNWQVANLLGETAVDILRFQERYLPGRHLRGRGWGPPDEVQAYLDAGLHTTFADYPPGRPRGRFAIFRSMIEGRPEPTPFEMDVGRVVEFLESQLEAGEDERDSA